MPYKEVSEEDLKIYWSIGEVADIFGCYTSLLRFWEEEFVNLRPKKGKKGERQYKRKDIHTVKEIHFLVKHVKLTLYGAKDVFALGLLPKFKEMYNYDLYFPELKR